MSANKTPVPGTPQSLSGLLPFVHPYRLQVFSAGVFLLLATGSTLLFPWALRELIDQGLMHADQRSELAYHFVQLFGVAVALAVFSAMRFYMVSMLGERVTADIRNAVYSHVLEQSPSFFETTQTGEVLSRLSSDTTLVQTVVGSSLSMGLRNLVMGVGALLMLVWTNPLLMLQVIAVLILVVFPSVKLGRRVRRLSRASQDLVADASAIAAEVLNAIPVVQSYTAQKRESNRFIDASKQAVNTALRRTRARSILVGFITMASSAALLWGLYQGTLSVQAGITSAGELGQTVVYVILLASAFAVLGEVYGDLLRAAGATERLMELLHSKSDVQDPFQPVDVTLPKQGSTLQLDAVEFRYPSRPDTSAIHALNATIEAGQTVAVVGPSGAGKTTLFALLLRFYDPQSGHIFLNNTAIDTMRLNDLRQQIGLVPQDAAIFSGTAMDNIRYGKPDASDDQVKVAAQAAFADKFITALPQGYDTFLGERGVRLSGGQRQRISIARAILKNPPLLLLDEATSALDAHSERMVQAALETAMKNRTTLVIAHRLATVQKADIIWVMDHGQLVEQGTHTQLLAKGGLYASLAALQFGTNEISSI
ncbi:MAG: ATP-binding cassette domain-containing protein [Limnohabitans sp.]|nr:ATP-binding cassette domain-containing protein [Limnohabitans sp.]